GSMPRMVSAIITSDLFESFQNTFGGALPRKLLDLFFSPSQKLATLMSGLVPGLFQGVGDFLGVGGVNGEAGLAHDFWQTTGVGHDGNGAQRQRFERRNAEAFQKADLHRNSSLFVELTLHVIADKPRDDDLLLQRRSLDSV